MEQRKWGTGGWSPMPCSGISNQATTFPRSLWVAWRKKRGQRKLGEAQRSWTAQMQVLSPNRTG